MRNESTFYKFLQYFFQRLANQGVNQCQQLQVHFPAVTAGLTVTRFFVQNNWGTSQPKAFTKALQQASEEQRTQYQHRWRHLALILPPKNS